MYVQHLISHIYKLCVLDNLHAKIIYITVESNEKNIKRTQIKTANKNYLSALTQSFSSKLAPASKRRIAMAVCLLRRAKCNAVSGPLSRSAPRFIKYLEECKHIYVRFVSNLFDLPDFFYVALLCC